jgi:DNA polymerase
LVASRREKANAVATGKTDETESLKVPPPPETLPEFRQWLLTIPLPELPAAERLDAIGDPAGGIMILVDMPDPGDYRAGHLVAGDAGLLLDKMLAAIGRDRDSIYLATLCPARSTGGRIGDESLELLTKIAHHHVALVDPKCVLAMGDAASRAVCGAKLDQARGKKHFLNHNGGSVASIATFHPRFLQQQPRFKAKSWQDLQMLMEGIAE